MRLDLLEQPGEQHYQADVCVVGAGAAGIVLTRALIGAGLRVCLLEAGGLDYEADTQALYEGANVGMTYYPLAESRLRFFGGTTNIWGGRCALLDPIDFARRDWVPHSGWPIAADTLAPYLPAVHDTLELGEVRYDASLWRDLGRSEPPFDPAALTTRFWRFDDLAERFNPLRAADLLDSDRVQVVCHANVTHVQAAPDAARVTEVRAASLGGGRAVVRAPAFVLACGGIENARLLLASNDVEPAGLGNRHDQVGRYFMEHPHGRAASLTGRGVFGLWAGFEKRRLPGPPAGAGGGPYVAPVVLPAAAAQARAGILNTALTFKVQRDPRRGVPLSRQLYQSLKHGLDPTRRGRGLWHLYRYGREQVRRLRVPVEQARVRLGLRGVYAMIRAEQAPNPASRVTLGRDRDALGMPRAQLDWRLSELDKRTVSALVALLDGELARLGLGRAEAAPWLAEPGVEWPVDGTVGNHPIGGYHHMGTTRMSDAPATGVVDANCRVHGYGNLYIAGSSVFATSGWANPTLTILALALRLADHLVARIR